MVSALFQHIPIPKKVSALLQQNSVRLIPPFVCVIPTDFEIENSVRLNTAVSKKVSALLQQSPKKCPPKKGKNAFKTVQHIFSNI